MIIAMAGLPGTGKSAHRRRDYVRSSARRCSTKTESVTHCLRPITSAYSTEQDDVCQSIMLEATAYLLNTDRRQHVILDGRTFSRRYQVADLDSFAPLCTTFR